MEAYLRRRHKAPSSSSSSLHPKDFSSVNPFSLVSYHPDWTKVTPRVYEIYPKWVDLQSSFLTESLESYQVPSFPLNSPKYEKELGLHLPEFKHTTPISYSIPSTSTKREETFYVYSNALFEYKEEYLTPTVQRLVVKIPLKLSHTCPP